MSDALKREYQYSNALRERNCLEDSFTHPKRARQFYTQVLYIISITVVHCFFTTTLATTLKIRMNFRFFVATRFVIKCSDVTIVFLLTFLSVFCRVKVARNKIYFY